MYLRILMKVKLNWDGVGIATSLACAIHCGLLPVIAPMLPLLGISVSHNGIFEWSMIGIAFVVGSYSLYHGYIKHHRQYSPAILFSIGFVFLITKQFFLSLETIFLTLAVIFIISAHYKNYRLSQKSKCSSPHHKH